MQKTRELPGALPPGPPSGLRPWTPPGALKQAPGPHAVITLCSFRSLRSIHLHFQLCTPFRKSWIRPWVWYELNSGILHDCEGKKWNLLIFNLFNGNAFLNIVILNYLLMRRDLWFENHLVVVGFCLFVCLFLFLFCFVLFCFLLPQFTGEKESTVFCSFLRW